MGSKLKRRFYLNKSSFSFVMLPILILLLNGCSSGLKLTSDWQQSEMNIDGSDSEWQRGLYYDKQSDIVYSVRNDDKFIYVFLKTQNRSTQMQIMKQGLTVWFDKEDGKNQTFGIQYPINWKKGRTGFSSDTNEENLHAFLDQEFPEMEIIGPKKEDIQRYSALEAPGIRAKLGLIRETLVYELRVPLKKTSEHPFAAEPISAHRIGIEFETGEIQPEQMKSGMSAGNADNKGDEMGEDNPAAGVGIGSSRRPHSGGEQSGHFGKQERTARMELWLSVQLAKPISQ